MTSAVKARISPFSPWPSTTRLHRPHHRHQQHLFSTQPSSRDGCSSDEGFRLRDKQAFRKQKLKIVCEASGEKLCLILMSSFLHWVGEATSPSSFPSSIVNGLLRGRKRGKSERNQNEQFYVVLCLVERGKPEVVAAKKNRIKKEQKTMPGWSWVRRWRSGKWEAKAKNINLWLYW